MTRGTFLEPWGDRESIYEHIVRHVDAITGCLDPEAEELPDEDYPERRKWPFPPGGLDAAFADIDPSVGTWWASGIHAALVRAADTGSPEAFRSLHQYTTRAMPECVEPLLEQIGTRRDIRPERLLALGKWLATRAPDRESVKIGIALLGLDPDEEAMDILTTLAKHDEFTLRAAAAVIITADEPDEILWEMAQCVDGWGRIGTIRMLEDTWDPEIKGWLLREGHHNSISNHHTARFCAEAGDLVEALAMPDPDDGLIRGAGEILTTLIDEEMGGGIDDYEEGPRAVDLFLGALRHRRQTLEDLLVVTTIRGFLRDGEADWAGREARGWSPDLVARLGKQCDAIVSDPGWAHEVIDGLMWGEDDTLVRSSEAARHLHIDAWPLLFGRLPANEYDVWLWTEVCQTTDPVRFRQVIDFAVANLELEEIATGTSANLGHAGFFLKCCALNAVLEALPRFPGEGRPLIRAALTSPMLSNRGFAVTAVDSWGRDRWGPEVEAALREAVDREPETVLAEEIRQQLAGVLASWPPEGTGEAVRR